MYILSVGTVRTIRYFKIQMKLNSDILNSNTSVYSYNPNIFVYSDICIIYLQVGCTPCRGAHCGNIYCPKHVGTLMEQTLNVDYNLNCI